MEARPVADLDKLSFGDISIITGAAMDADDLLYSLAHETPGAIEWENRDGRWTPSYPAPWTFLRQLGGKRGEALAACRELVAGGLAEMRRHYDGRQVRLARRGLARAERMRRELHEGDGPPWEAMTEAERGRAADFVLFLLSLRDRDGWRPMDDLHVAPDDPDRGRLPGAIKNLELRGLAESREGPDGPELRLTDTGRERSRALHVEASTSLIRGGPFLEGNNP